MDELIHKALSVLDIVEGILLGLPLRQIILARCVCHQFDYAFRTSPRIRRALFLEAVRPPVTFGPDPNATGKFTAWTWQKPDGKTVQPILNPFIAL